ncbi:glutathione peroxidase [Pseudomonas sp. Irchel s3h17]|uniref:glutathione peroxidase n=1 Tax=Pseudomonas sp. Irchel s3h17 TaxID=2009182 RepID=UPI000BA47792|nr:glutathione peroxidase [Pseudomonas sp. Irchel s3h17]
MPLRWLAVPALVLAVAGSALAAGCPPLYSGSLTRLHAKDSIDLCQRFAGKPLVVVNTASFCGFAPQFKGLEALYQRYKGQGLEMLGVPSNDFKQESGDGAETAKVCYVNYGVTFTMTEMQKVRGPDAVHLFKILAEQSSSPKWNFYKYVVDRQGKVIGNFSSLTKPDNPEFIRAVEQALASRP